MSVVFVPLDYRGGLRLWSTRFLANIDGGGGPHVALIDRNARRR